MRGLACTRPRRRSPSAPRGPHRTVAFDAPLSWIQPSQYWRFVDALGKFLGTIPHQAAEQHALADHYRNNTSAAEALLGRPFEHAEALKTALDQQRAVNEAMQAVADRSDANDEPDGAALTPEGAGGDVEPSTKPP
jgi:hypothetical protein